VLSGERKARAIARGEELRFSVPAITVYRTDSVDDVPRRKKIASRNPCVAGRATAERATLSQKLRARRAMDRTVHTASAEQCLVRCIHDCVSIERDDVRLQRLQLVAHAASPQP
jgi:hypothetical protein